MKLGMVTRQAVRDWLAVILTCACVASAVYAVFGCGAGTPSPQTVVTDEERACAALLAIRLPSADHAVIGKACSVVDPAALEILASYEAAEDYEDGGLAAAIVPVGAGLEAAAKLVEAVRGLRDGGVRDVGGGP